MFLGLSCIRLSSHLVVCSVFLSKILGQMLLKVYSKLLNCLQNRHYCFCRYCATFWWKFLGQWHFCTIGFFIGLEKKHIRKILETNNPFTPKSRVGPGCRLHLHCTSTWVVPGSAQSTQNPGQPSFSLWRSLQMNFLNKRVGRGLLKAPIIIFRH